MQYNVVFGDDLGKLISAVSALIVQGWIPQGGVCHTTNFSFCQAMIRMPQTTPPNL